ncbi:MAG: hypothetical protein KJ077_43565 [Anaerolineae bacterium]|nr:hypothetical protein [Anaerolineae bacterium]
MYGKDLAHRIGSARGAGWLVAGLASLAGLWFTIQGFNQLYTANWGWLWLTTLVVAGGIGTHLYQRRKSKLTACLVKPQIYPLQVSCLAVQTLGVQWLWYAASPDFVAVMPPFLAWTGWPYLCIVSGVAGLGWLSLYCDCRNEALCSFERSPSYPNRSV